MVAGDVWLLVRGALSLVALLQCDIAPPPCSLALCYKRAYIFCVRFAFRPSARDLWPYGNGRSSEGDAALLAVLMSLCSLVRSFGALQSFAMAFGNANSSQASEDLRTRTVRPKTQGRTRCVQKSKQTRLDLLALFCT